MPGEEVHAGCCSWGGANLLATRPYQSAETPTSPALPRSWRRFLVQYTVNRLAMSAVSREASLAKMENEEKTSSLANR